MHVNPISLLQNQIGGIDESASKSTGFGDMMMEKLSTTNTLLNQSDALLKRFTAGEKIDIHRVGMMLEEASMALNLALEIRNRGLDGFKEIMRMQV